MSYSKPAPTTYLQLPPESKTIDLVGLLRRLCAEYQYHDPYADGNLAEIEKLESATSKKRVLKLIEKRLETPWSTDDPWKEPEKEEVTEFLSKMPVTRYAFRRKVGNPDVPTFCGRRFMGLGPIRVTAKDFKYVKTTPEGCPNAAGLKKEKLRQIYWKLRMRLAFPNMSFSLGLIIEELKKQKYAGLQLPNGKVVPFKALYCVLFSYAPKKLSLFEYSLPAGIETSGNSLFQVCPPELIELKSGFAFGPNSEIFCHHFVFALNLPEEDAQGNLGKLMIIDPTCAQFGMGGTYGELLYWGFSEDYVKSFPSREMRFKEDDLYYNPYNYRNNETCYPRMWDLIKATVKNFNLDSCGYCGDVARKTEDGEIKLKRCSRCMKAYYCDVVCQKLGWKSHKLECKKESE